MLRAGLLWLSEQPQVFRFVRSSRLAQKFASRFVAGETVDTAIAVLKDLNAANLTVSLDLLGESVSSPEEAKGAQHSYLELLDRIQ
ncbi:MAG TPA: proline dehydrogenase, partial [Thermoanaerobaculia bacterium]|nr:proline dehydrogenase [Thermoanaerobaculia bacterium]